jgi:Spy/CpxP family protein refolding chaperone
MRLQNSRHWTLLLFCGLAGIALLASPTLAQNRGGRSNTPGGFAEGRLMKKNATEIGLSEETIKKIDAAIEVGIAEETKIREQSAAAIEALNGLLATSRPSEKELLAAANKAGELATKSRELKVKSVVEMRSLLTDEQLAKFMEIRQNATSRR